VTTNSTWHLQAKVRMYDQATGEPIKTTHCNPKNVLSNWCLMVRLVTSKPKQVVNNETATRRRLAGDDEVESEFLFETFRDTTQVWNDDGSYVELNVYLLLNEGNSGSGLNSFLPYVAGGPPDSVLVVDDVSLYRTSGGDQYSESLPPPKTCSSVGDPHLESHYGILYDNHQSGWTALFDAEGIKIETEQVFLSGSTNVMFNRGWRVSENGTLIVLERIQNVRLIRVRYYVIPTMKTGYGKKETRVGSIVIQIIMKLVRLIGVGYYVIPTMKNGYGKKETRVGSIVIQIIMKLIVGKLVKKKRKTNRSLSLPRTQQNIRSKKTRKLFLKLF